MAQPIVKQFNKGLVTKIEKQSIARGAASSSLNWQFNGDHISLRRGQTRLGVTANAGTGRVSGLKVAKRADGTQIPFWTQGRKVYYYDSASDDNVEISTDLLAAAASSEDISIDEYNSVAGAFVYVSSPNSSIYKIPVANPGSAVDLLSTTYKGKMKIKQARMFLWDRKDDFGGKDETGLYLSHIDQTTSAYQQTTGEDIGTGDGSTKAFSGTLAFKASESRETCFGVVIAAGIQATKTVTAVSKATAAQITTSAAHGYVVGDTVVLDDIVGMTEMNNRIGVVLTVPSSTTFTINVDSTDFTNYTSDGTVSKAERFVDDKNGVLASVEGGTGTINYSTGAWSVTFNTAPVNGEDVVAQYYRERSYSNGITDFSFSATRLAGEGNIFRQDDGGGKFMTAQSFGDAEYCFHEFKTWVLTLTSTDTGATNLIYREGVGIPYHKASVATGDGIYYLDKLVSNPAVRILEYGRFLSNVVPRSISDQLDLTGYEFDTAVMFEWGNYICLACRTQDETVNNRMFMYNRIWKTWELHSFRASTLDNYNGALIAGDSGSPNVFKLFSDLTDEEAIIENHVITGDDYLDKEGVKVVNRMKVAGLISEDQKLEVSVSIDNEPFNLVQTINGRADYVDATARKAIGNTVLGEEQIGGEYTVDDDVILAAPYEVEFYIGTRRFQRIRVKFEATAIGYVSVSEYGFVDIRDKGRRLPIKYVA